ncbi:hypothetical protein EDB80DRAFT_707357 [Ilyonectria destructans]|nr:hypothetical protein EDB80DRAFT_707357 [Ilyonectria destructans]
MQGGVLRRNQRLLAYLSVSLRGAGYSTRSATRFIRPHFYTNPPVVARRSCSSCRPLPPFPPNTESQSPSTTNMADVGAWGAWQVEPSAFTKVVAESMQKL